MRTAAVLVIAARVLRGSPNVVQAVPLTRTLRDSGAEVVIEPDDYNGLSTPSATQCPPVRVMAVGRVRRYAGNAGGVALQQVRNILAVILDP